MKYLKTYKIFEENDFDVSPNDSLNVKKTKEQLSVVRKNIDEYKSLKSRLEQIYKNSKTDDEISNKVENLLGADKEGRNPFLVSYLTVCNDERKLQKLINSLSEDEISINRLKDMMSITDDNNQKGNIAKSIDEIKKRSAKTKSDISKLKSDIQKRRGDIEAKIKKDLNDIQEDIKKITKNQK